ncbi:MAG: SMC-Scp complex subunit ScpB, partial [Chryseobacterium sp.]
MELEQLMLHTEALIFASQQPITQAELAEYLSNIVEVPIEPARIQQVTETIVEKYKSEHFPFELKETGGGYQFLTKSAYHQT